MTPKTIPLEVNVSAMKDLIYRSLLRFWSDEACSSCCIGYSGCNHNERGYSHCTNRVMDIILPTYTWYCTPDNPAPKDHTGRTIHYGAKEVPDSQRDGWPSGDTVKLRCEACGATWTEELPQ